MKILIAPDSFKDSLSAVEVADCIEKGIRRVAPEIECVMVPMADGGEGTVHAIIQAVGGRIISLTVRDPLMRDVASFYGLTPDGKTAIIEMAAASGLERLKPEERNPLHTSSYGTGQLISAAIGKGVERIILGIGGSATNDGGAGLAEALGVQFSDKDDNPVHPCGANLNEITKIVTDNIKPELKNPEIIIAGDVNNRLCGPEGASRIYGPQKGATPEMVELLENNLLHYGKLLEKIYNKSFMSIIGTGAAGGLAVSLLAFTNAVIEPGFEVISTLTDFENQCKESDIIITGEGKIDDQTFFGKTLRGILDVASKYNKPVIAITGNYNKTDMGNNHPDFSAVVPIIDKPCSLDFALVHAPGLIMNAAERIMKLISIKS